MNTQHQQSLLVPRKWLLWGICLGVASWLGTSSVAHAATKPASQNPTTLKIAQSQSAEDYFERGSNLIKQGKYRQAIELILVLLTSTPIC
jgi:hypothetical protein